MLYAAVYSFFLFSRFNLVKDSSFAPTISRPFLPLRGIRSRFLLPLPRLVAGILHPLGQRSGLVRLGRLGILPPPVKSSALSRRAKILSLPGLSVRPFFVYYAGYDPASLQRRELRLLFTVIPAIANLLFSSARLHVCYNAHKINHFQVFLHLAYENKQYP